MTRWLLLSLCLPACSVVDGQKITVLLRDREVECVTAGDGTRVGRLTLDQPDDLYVAELVNFEGDDAVSIPSTRTNKEVVFECPEGFDGFVVRHATVLQARAAAE